MSQPNETNIHVPGKLKSHDVMIMKSNGHINITKLVNANKKQTSHWRENASTKMITNELSEMLDVDPSYLIRADISSRHRGTYVHPILALDALYWSSPKEKIKLYKTILESSETNSHETIPVAKNGDIIDKSSGIYLIKLGITGDLRHILDIPQDYPKNSVVYKYGKSHNIPSRFSAHCRTYTKTKGYDPVLVYSKYVDCRYLSTAENEIKDLFIRLGVKLEHKNYFELIIVSDSQLPIVMTIYDGVASKYQGVARVV